MSRKTIENIKTNKPFMWWDILVYVLLALLVVGLFWGIVWSKDNDKITAVEIVQNDIVILTYDFATDEMKTYSSFVKVDTTSHGYMVTVTNQDGKGFNKMAINIYEKSVDVVDANCSRSKECMHTRPITHNTDSIICMPHSLIIRAVSDTIKPPISG